MTERPLGIFPNEQETRVAYKALFMDSPAGRDILQDLMLRNYFFASTIGDGSVGNMAYNNGRRDAVIDILALTLQYTPQDPQAVKDIWDRALETRDNERRTAAERTSRAAE